jgi:hypothetical protein
VGLEPTAKLIRSIGFGYALDFMPAPFLVGYNQLRRKMKRAGLKVHVSLVPLSDLPPDLDVLFVPAQLLDTARRLAPDKWIISLDSYLNHPSYTKLVERLTDGSEIYALRIQDMAPQAGNPVLRYLGNVRVD